jgi:hypothetical protein
MPPGDPPSKHQPTHNVAIYNDNDTKLKTTFKFVINASTHALELTKVLTDKNVNPNTNTTTLLASFNDSQGC